MEVLKTQLQMEREKRDRAIYDDYNRMMSIEGQSATEVTKALMAKYKIHSAGTIYIIRKRVQESIDGKEATS